MKHFETQMYVRFIKILLAFFTPLLLCVSCEFDETVLYTGEVTEIYSDEVIFSAKIADLNKDGVSEFGFICESDRKTEFFTSRVFKVNDRPSIGVINYAAKINLKKNTRYYVKSYVKVLNTYVYGNEVNFSSGSFRKQIIDDIVPNAGNLGDTIIILGQNFNSNKSSNLVKIDKINSTVIRANQDSLFVVVPTTLKKPVSELSVTILEHEVVSDSAFNLIPPIVNESQSITGRFGDTINIYGKNFSSNPSTLLVSFNGYFTKIVDIKDDILSVIVPITLTEKSTKIAVRMNNLNSTSKVEFQLEPFCVSDVYPKTACTGEKITITGNNFSPVSGNNIVTIGGLKATIYSASVDKLVVIIPNQSSGIYSSRNAPISVKVCKEILEYNGTILINDKWFKHKNASVDLTDSFITVVGNKAYIGLNSKGGFWEFDPTLDTFKALPSFPGSARVGGAGFSLENKIYYGTGCYNKNSVVDFWEYDISTGLWERKNDFPGEPRTSAISFFADGTGFIGGGSKVTNNVWALPYNDFWSYDQVNDNWGKISSFNGSDSLTYLGMADGISVLNGDTVYMGLGWYKKGTNMEYDKRWYMYNTSDNSWSQLSPFPYLRSSADAIAFILNGIPYIKTYFSNSFYTFDIKSNAWAQASPAPSEITSNGIGFTIGNVAYVVIGKTIWEYDPSR